MKDFVDAHSGKFNESQVKAMCDVSNMNEVDFLLIQGPRKYKLNLITNFHF